MQSDPAFIFTSEPDNFSSTATQSGDSWRVNIKFWHTNHHHSNKESLATAAAAQKEIRKGREILYKSPFPVEIVLIFPHIRITSVFKILGE